ncbi:non-specific serine/threonine protein kinase [Pseudomonas chlororaphis subsp. aurantiaca]|uniref:type I Zorya anti-phage system protein ZorD n=1 Tax=Pseudomonas chlororaphis TaxID=587753 RepID=UPI000866637C|nr:type I Zorya anti-phage system protein ZorD [Pseudomonas chlororaphis]BAV74565.1 non-specific serine/threonine protein kinase [Pseudomonas chlororaphis subsp. aurantiaca]
MLKRFLKGIGLQQDASLVTTAPVFSIEEQGLCYPLSLAEDAESWPLASYLDQLEEEEFVSQLSDRWLLTWDELYRLIDDPDHATSVPLLGLPAQTKLVPQLSSQGSLASNDFKVTISGWRDPQSNASIQIQRIGGTIQCNGAIEVLPESSWRLTGAVRQLYLAQQSEPGEVTNQIGWASIRKLARNASAGMDGFLDKTVVIKPESLRLNPRKSTVGNTPVIELEPSFEGQPANWLESFDGAKQVQDRYRVTDDDGSLTHVLIEPEVKSVLDYVRSLPGRRVAGDDALSFVRNPYSALGDSAAQVLDADTYEEDLIEAGIFFHRFHLEPKLDDAGHRIERVNLTLEPISPVPQASIEITFNAAHELAPFVHELHVKLAAGMPAGFWQGYELELSDFDLRQLAGIGELLKRWQNEAAGIEFDSVLDLSLYGDRVTGIGEAERITSPFLVKEATENWLPPDVAMLGIDAEILGRWDPSDRAQFEVFEQRLDEARAAGDESVYLPESETPLPIAVAEQLFDAWSKKIVPVETALVKPVDKVGRAVLQIGHNIDEPTYVQVRQAALRSALDATPELPNLLKPEVVLRDHQLQGVAWLQHLFRLSPTDVSGCLLADDMGLGKTIQLLTFLVWYLEKYPEDKPTLIVAPVSLLDNWERELRRFFFADALPVLKLYGSALSAVKFKKEEIPADLKGKGIKNLLRPGWMGDAKIVLTTYETLRDQEFSLARQQWSIVVCDEAQKLKNPAALVTQAVKAIPARFRVACTGTPVENTLIDLWCLFDFIQPGFLGGLNQFGREYQRPIEAGLERDTVALERLRGLIEPQTLRRTKQDIAKDLPAKIEDSACRALFMHTLQRNLYLSEVSAYSQKQQINEQLDQKASHMLGLLHKLKLICAHPYSVQPDKRLRDNSPKLQWLMQTLESIKRAGKGDKVIVFTELRDIQRELQYAIQEHFGFRATVINGETSTSSQSANSRQKLIDQFQELPGFGVIILSTIAVGFGVNVQAANHVIHFTRCWNPAKEDQATDRAYRIGQEKDVYVYYPTIRDEAMPTFEATLDELLSKRRALARDMLSGASEIQASEFEALLGAR